MPARIVILVVLNVVFRISVTKSVGKNLIKYRTFSPVGNFEARYKRKIKFRLNVFNAAQTVIRDSVVFVRNRKIICHPSLRALESVRIIIERTVRSELGHFMAFAVDHGFRFQNVVGESTQNKPDCVSCFGLVRLFEISRFVRKKRIFVNHCPILM